MHLFCYCCLLGREFGDLRITIAASTVYFEKFLSKGVGAELEVSPSFISLVKIYSNVNSKRFIL